MCGYSKQCFCRGCNISAYISVTTSLCNNDNALHLRHIFFGDIRLTALLRIVINIAAGDSEIRVEVKKFNYMMTDDDQYPVPTQTQSGWIFVNGGEPGVPGDADGDGVVTAADALLVMRCALGTAELSPETAALCDTDGDGNVTLSDAVLILRAALGLG